MPIFILGFVVVIAISIFWAISIYNRLVRMRNLVKNSYSQIDVQLKRRYDLIPNLVEVAKGYLKHERETLESVIAARNQCAGLLAGLKENPTSGEQMQKLISSEGNLSGALSRLMVVAEAYPDLKANTTMAALSEELSSTENKVSFARQAFNDSVMDYNNQREQFPNSIFAGIYNFQAATAFEITTAAEKETPKVLLA